VIGLITLCEAVSALMWSEQSGKLIHDNQHDRDGHFVA